MSERIVVQDEQKMLSRIVDLPNQLEKAWTSVWTKSLPVSKDAIDRVLIVGMGGSGIAGQLARELFADSPTPIDTWADYGVPGWVDGKTLLLAVSYSGNTEETIDATKKAIEHGAQVVAITTGGKLSELCAANKALVVTVDYKSSPREALGWLYGSILVLLSKLQLVALTEPAYFAALKDLQAATADKKIESQTGEIALSLNNKLPIIVSQAPLTSVARRWVTQLNENGKTFAVSAALPELCHNLLVGLDYYLTEKLQVVYLESAFAFSRNIVRGKIIQQIFEQKSIPFLPLSVKAGSALAEQWLFIYLGDIVSYNVAGVNGVDPSPVEAIDFLKKELSNA